MAAAEIGALLGTIFSILLSVTGIDQILGSVNSALKQRIINNDLRPLAESIAKNRPLANQIIRAYQNKNAELVNSLIGGSTFGSRYKTIQKLISDNSKKIESAQYGMDLEDAKVAQLERQKQQAAEESTGSIIGDLIVEAKPWKSSPTQKITNFFSQRRMNSNNE